MIKHGLDFADAHLVYDSPLKITLSSQRNMQDRSLDLAAVERAGTVLALVYIELGSDESHLVPKSIAKGAPKYEQAKEQD